MTRREREKRGNEEAGKKKRGNGETEDDNINLIFPGNLRRK
jgi:hypothetical protein